MLAGEAADPWLARMLLAVVPSVIGPRYVAAELEVVAVDAAAVDAGALEHQRIGIRQADSIEIEDFAGTDDDADGG